MKHGYRSRWWGSFQSIKQAGGHVRKGEKATNVIFFRPVTKTVVSASGEETEESFPLMRTFSVFSVEQTCGLEYLWAGRTELASAVLDERYEKADAAIASTVADIRYGFNAARYCPSGDYIELPYRHQFTSMADYYETICHELTHWTEHPSRLNWDRKNTKHSYAMGELIAEIGACFLCAELGLPTAESMDNHHAYLKSWISALENDPKLIFAASAQASRAVDFIMSFSRQEAEQPDEALVG